ncbi:hypothetical protein ACFL4G_02205 [Thermodesulfobacteriota bacterium]
MIDEETAFILGAGASAPYNYPTGERLKNFICKEFPSKIKGYSNKRDRQKEIEASHAKRMAKDLKQSGDPSIDSFLDSSPHYNEIGKFAILCAIYHYEQHTQYPWDLIDDSKKKDWFTYLWENMKRDLKGSHGYERLCENKVSFITFNYDRSLEYFFYTSITRKYNGTNFTNKMISETIPPIKHIYGKIADLPWESEKGKEFTFPTDRYPDRQLVNNIKLINERTVKDTNDINKIITKAKRIFFLGFGYLEENMKILNIPESLRDNPEKKLFGTMLDLDERDQGEISRRIAVRHETKHFPPVDCAQLLKSFL